MKQNLHLAILIALAFALAACAQSTATPEAIIQTVEVEKQAAPAAAAPTERVVSTFTPTIPPPKFTSRPAPGFSTSLGAFTFGGCDEQSGVCPPDSAIGQLGCQRVEGRDLLGGLTPPVPAAWCIYETGAPPNPEGYQFIAKPNPHYRATVVYTDGQYSLLSDQSALQAIYAPVDSPEEAISYAASELKRIQAKLR